MSSSESPLPPDAKRSRPAVLSHPPADTVVAGDDVALSLPARTSSDTRSAAAAAASAAAVSHAQSSKAGLAAATAAYQSAVAQAPIRSCPYLSTINRDNIDFDFDKICSATLSPVNVYCCLVCGVFLSGRGKGTPAYTHSLEQEHNVFISLSTARVFCLPDGYEVSSPSLEDIKLYLSPRFTALVAAAIDGKAPQKAIAAAASSTGAVDTGAGSALLPSSSSGHDASAAAAAAAAATANVPVTIEGVVVAGRGVKGSATALDGAVYLPGAVGLNEPKHCSWLTASAQLLLRVAPLRRFFLRPENYEASHSPLVHAWGEFVRKVCWPQLPRAHVSPHCLLQAVSEASDRRFTPGQAADPFQFLQWSLNALHKELASVPAAVASAPSGGAAGKPAPTRAPVAQAGGSIVSRLLRGEVTVTATPPPTSAAEAPADGSMTDAASTTRTPTVTRVPFFHLSLPLPEQRNTLGADKVSAAHGLNAHLALHQVPIANMLARFNGFTETTRPDETVVTQTISRLPRYLLVHFQRFRKNEFFREKNQTLVSFPLSGLDMLPYLAPEPAAKAAAALTGHPGSGGKHPLPPAPPLRSELSGLPVAQLKGMLQQAQGRLRALEARLGPVAGPTAVPDVAVAAAAAASSGSTTTVELETEAAAAVPGFYASLSPSSGATSGAPLEKSELVNAVAAAQAAAHAALKLTVATKYSLVANLVHEGDASSEVYKCHILHKPSGVWYETQSMTVTTDTAMARLVEVSQPYIQLYELQGSDGDAV